MAAGLAFGLMLGAAWAQGGGDAAAVTELEDTLSRITQMLDLVGVAASRMGAGFGFGVWQVPDYVVVDATLALAAARLSTEERLPLADSVILATARTHGATLWTQDGDFEGRDGVRYVPA
jgi:predicted nucleic acid-binding protein